MLVFARLTGEFFAVTTDVRLRRRIIGLMSGSNPAGASRSELEIVLTDERLRYQATQRSYYRGKPKRLHA